MGVEVVEIVFVMILLGIFVKEEFSVKITKLNKAVLYVSIGALFVLIALLVLYTI